MFIPRFSAKKRTSLVKETHATRASPANSDHRDLSCGGPGDSRGSGRFALAPWWLSGSALGQAPSFQSCGIAPARRGAPPGSEEKHHERCKQGNVFHRKKPSTAVLLCFVVSLPEFMDFSHFLGRPFWW